MIELTPELEAAIAAVPIPAALAHKPLTKKQRKNAAYRQKTIERGVTQMTVRLPAEVMQSIAMLQHEWPGIRTPQHCIEVAVRWMAKETTTGNARRIEL